MLDERYLEFMKVIQEKETTLTRYNTLDDDVRKIDTQTPDFIQDLEVSKTEVDSRTKSMSIPVGRFYSNGSTKQK